MDLEAAKPWKEIDMENETTEQVETPTEPTENDIQMSTSEKKSEAPAELREHAKRQEKRASALEQRVLEADLEAIGLKPDEGLGLAIAESYDGDFSEGDVARYAETKYRHTAGHAPVPPSVEAGERLEQVQAASVPVTPPPEEDRVATAEGRLVSEDAGRKDAIASINEKTRAIQSQQ